MDGISKVAVIGAGLMGAGIAAQIANAGIPVLLLDVVPPGATNRNTIAESAIAKLLKTAPAAFMSKAAARYVAPGNIEDDLRSLVDCDWIIEAVVEKLEVKQGLYRRIDEVRKAGSVVSSNTSTIPLAALIEGLAEKFARDFCITHFFNPPRFMRLLEIISGPATRPDAIESVSRFADFALGKSVVRCKDRPGFIANRIGIFWILSAMAEASEAGLDVEEADAVLGQPIGIPKTGVFGLLDLVGLDLVPHITASMASALPADDPFHNVNRDLSLIAQMIKNGQTGRKGKGGFYRESRSSGGKIKEAISLSTGEYRARRKVEWVAPNNLKALLSAQDKLGQYAWSVMGRTLSYAAAVVPEVADDIASVDEAMRLGFNWKLGPFELIDRLGVDWFIARLEQHGFLIPNLLRAANGRSFYRVENGRRQALATDGEYRDVVRADGVLLLEDIKTVSQPVLKNGSAALWDIGDGVACLEFTTKLNTLDSDSIALVGESLHLVAERFKALVIYNEATDFSAGANLGPALFMLNIAAWSEIEEMIGRGQETYRAMKYAPFPVVGAPSGLALGGGCEILLHCDAVQAHAETYMGLVECGVGLIPAWGGCKEMLHRLSISETMPRGPMPPVARAFEIISTARVSKSAAEAKELQYLRSSDRITMNRSRLLTDAKALALELARDYRPPAEPEWVLPGESAAIGIKSAVDSYFRRGLATSHDLRVSEALAEVLSGGAAEVTRPLRENDLLQLERSQFLVLLHEPNTVARIEHMLETGKPLRN